MADNNNHNSTWDANQEIISIDEHLKATDNPKYYMINKMMNDYSLVFRQHLTEEELECENYQLPIKGRLNREYYSTNNLGLSVPTIRQALTTKHIWEIIYLNTPFHEDSSESEESSEEDSQDDGKKKEKAVVLKERHGLEYFIKKEKDILKKR